MNKRREEFIKRFKSTFICDLLSETLTDEQLFEHIINTNGDIIWFKDQTRQMWFMWQQAQKQAIPDGYVVVPKEPTKVMCQAGEDMVTFGGGYDDIYKTMIEAVEKNDE